MNIPITDMLSQSGYFASFKQACMLKLFQIIVDYAILDMMLETFIL